MRKRRRLTPVAQRPVTAISRPGEMIKFGTRVEPEPSAPSFYDVEIRNYTRPNDTFYRVGDQIWCYTAVSGWPTPTRTYQWEKSATQGGVYAPIAGATDIGYLLLLADQDEWVRCVVTATNSEGSDQITSESVQVSAALPDAPQLLVSPVVSGNTVVGSVLSTDNGSWANGVDTYTYRWLRSGAYISGATDPTYTTVAGDIGHNIRSEVTATNAGGSNIAASGNFITVEPLPADRASELLAAETDGLAIAFADQTAAYKQTGSMLIKTASAGNVTGVLEGGVVYTGTSPKIVRQADNTLKHALHNCVIASEVLNGNRWSADVTTVTPNADAGPDGENNGTRITATGANPSLTNSLGDASPGQHFIMGARCKPDNVDFAVLQLADLTGGCFISYNVATGVFGQELTWSGGPVINAHGILPLLNGYYFIWMDVTTSDAYINQLRINPSRSADPNANTQSGDAIFCAGVSQQYAPGVLEYVENPDSATYTDKTFTLPVDHAANGDSLGVLNEPAATNLFLNSDAPATQSITVANGTEYTVSVHGGWTATLSDAGTGTATEGSPVTFTAGSTNLTVTITGSAGGDLNNVQVEVGAIATSPIITAASQVTRAADGYSFDATKTPWFPSTNGASSYYGWCNLKVNNGRMWWPRDPETQIIQWAGGWACAGGAYSGVGTPAPGNDTKHALAYEQAGGDDLVTAIAGALEPPFTTTQNYGAASTHYYGSDAGFAPVHGHLKEIMILPRKMSNAELQAITT